MSNPYFPILILIRQTRRYIQLSHAMYNKQMKARHFSPRKNNIVHKVYFFAIILTCYDKSQLHYTRERKRERVTVCDKISKPANPNDSVTY